MSKSERFFLKQRNRIRFGAGETLFEDFSIEQTATNGTFRFNGWGADTDFVLPVSADDFGWNQLVVTYDGSTLRIFCILGKPRYCRSCSPKIEIVLEPSDDVASFFWLSLWWDAELAESFVEARVAESLEVDNLFVSTAALPAATD